MNVAQTSCYPHSLWKKMDKDEKTQDAEYVASIVHQIPFCSTNISHIGKFTDMWSTDGLHLPARPTNSSICLLHEEILKSEVQYCAVLCCDVLWGCLQELNRLQDRGGCNQTKGFFVPSKNMVKLGCLGSYHTMLCAKKSEKHSRGGWVVITGRQTELVYKKEHRNCALLGGEPALVHSLTIK